MTPTPTDLTPEAVQALADRLRVHRRNSVDASFARVMHLDYEACDCAADALDAFAARLAQEAGTCETCQFAGERLRSIYGELGMYPNHRACKLLGARPGSPIQSNIVPLTLNGRPFRCAGWKAKETT